MKTISTRKARSLRRLIRLYKPYGAARFLKAPVSLCEEVLAHKIRKRFYERVYLNRQARAYVRKVDADDI